MWVSQPFFNYTGAFSHGSDDSENEAEDDGMYANVNSVSTATYSQKITGSDHAGFLVCVEQPNWADWGPAAPGSGDAGRRLPPSQGSPDGKWSIFMRIRKLTIAKTMNKTEVQSWFSRVGPFRLRLHHGHLGLARLGDTMIVFFVFFC